MDRKATVLHNVCVDGNLRSALAELREDPTLVERMDELGQYPLHCACANRRLYAFKIVELLVPLSGAVQRADTLGRLPLHIAVENIGPTHDTQVGTKPLPPHARPLASLISVSEADTVTDGADRTELP